jgi:hypothetical protein
VANTNFGGVQVSDGQSAPTSLLPNGLESLDWFNAGAIAVGVKKYERVMGFAGTIIDVRAYAETAPTTSSIVIDLMKNGVTMYTTAGNRPTISAAGNPSTTLLPDVLTFVAGDWLRFDVIQVGSGTPGSDVAISATTKTGNLA